MATYSIALIPGDGIGPEVLREGKKVLDAVASAAGINWQWHEYPFGAEHWLATRKGSDTLFSEEDMVTLSQHDAIYFGAVGDPRVPESVEQGGGLLYIRFYFDQYINLRPAKLLRGVETPLKGKRPHEIDFYVVRENSEDFYIGLGARFKGARASHDLQWRRKLYRANFNVNIDIDPADEVAYQVGAMTGRGAQRVMRYAFELARKKGMKRVTIVDKANVLTNIYGLWRDTAERVAADYPDIEHEYAIVDATTMWFVRRPEWFQVVVAPNMFGDIISDLAAATVGGMGIAPGGNINPDGGVSMFEPIHGSAPKYAGQNVANPIATILAGKMMLEHLGEERAAQLVEQACEDVLEEGKVRTYDLGGKSSCSDVGDAIAERVLKLR